MDLKSNPASPLLPENAALNISRLSLRPNVLPCSSPSSLPSPGLQLTVPRKKTGLLDDVRSNAFLDAMKASSPPPRKLSKDSSDDQDGEDTTYQTWLQKYPSGLSSFEQIASYAKGKQIVLFLDYDGTLSPIVDNPDFAFMSRSMRAAVRKAASCFPTAIISGRSCDKVTVEVLEFVKLDELYYAGSHGMDIMGPVQKSSFNNHARSPKNQMEGKIFQPASAFLPMINEVCSSLVESTKGITGAKVENNKFCVSVHYRNVDPTDWPAVGDIVQDILKDYPRLRMTHGRKVIEVRPVIDWDKGKAVTFLLESLGLNDRDDVLPIYVGDDRTDEDAFKVLREGNQGYGILVTSVPKDSNAYYSLRDPTEVMQFLKLLLQLKNSNAL